MLSPQGLGEGAEKGAGDGQPPSHAGERRSNRGGCRGLPEPVLATSGTRWVAPPWLSHTRGMGDPFPWVRGGRGLQEQQQLPASSLGPLCQAMARTWLSHHATGRGDHGPPHRLRAPGRTTTDVQGLFISNSGNGVRRRKRQTRQDKLRDPQD